MRLSDLDKFSGDIMLPFHQHDIGKVNNLNSLVRLSKRSHRYGVNYQGRRIGIITLGIDCWIAETPLQYGAMNGKLDTPQGAVNWLITNYLKVFKSGIKFSIDSSYDHCTIEKGYWLIKIDRYSEDDFVALIQDKNTIDYESFPDLQSAIFYSFDLILNPAPPINNHQIDEF